MGIWDDITGRTAARAQEQARAYLGQAQRGGQDSLNLGYRDQRQFLERGYAEGQDEFRRGSDNAGNALRAAAGGAQGYLDSGNQASLAALRDNFGRAGAAYDPLATLGQRYGGATSLLLDAMGAGGVDGQGRARSAFQAGPGFGFAVDQGLDAINRRRAASGMLASGNADREAQTFGQGLAQQEYDKWLAGLGQFVSPELSATSTVAQGRAGLGRDQGLAESDLARWYATGSGGLAERQGASLADLAFRTGSGLSNTSIQRGTALGGAASEHGVRSADNFGRYAGPIAGTITNEAAARAAGSGNLINLGMSAISLLPSLGGMLGGLGGLGGGFPASSNPTRIGSLY